MAVISNQGKLVLEEVPVWGWERGRYFTTSQEGVNEVKQCREERWVYRVQAKKKSLQS